MFLFLAGILTAAMGEMIVAGNVFDAIVTSLLIALLLVLDWDKARG